MVVDAWVTQTLREFGLRMGVTRFHANAHGVACAHISAIGSLFVEPKEDCVLVYLARDFGRLGVHELERVLTLVNPFEGHYPPIWSGLRKETQVVFGMKLDTRDFDSSRLETVVGLLRDLMNRVRQR